MLTRPEADEFAPAYAQSVNQVPEGDLLVILAREIEDTMQLLAGLDEDQADHRYQAGKWSIKEVIGHLADSERIMSYRALSFARGERAALAGYEQDDYVAEGNFGQQELDALAQELHAIRMATLCMFRSFDDQMFLRRGTASGCEFSVRALAYVMAGHEIHHKAVIRERYL